MMQKVHIPISIGAWSIMGAICFLCLIACIHSVCRHHILHNIPLAEELDAEELDTERVILAVEIPRS
jgi:hypothetical protein